jgi:hypothetical protein
MSKVVGNQRLVRSNDVVWTLNLLLYGVANKCTSWSTMPPLWSIQNVFWWQRRPTLKQGGDGWTKASICIQLLEFHSSNLFFLSKKYFHSKAFSCTLTFQFQTWKLQHVTNNEMLLSIVKQSFSPCSKTYKAYTLKHLILI